MSIIRGVRTLVLWLTVSENLHYSSSRTNYSLLPSFNHPFSQSNWQKPTSSSRKAEIPYSNKNNSIEKQKKVKGIVHPAPACLVIDEKKVMKAIDIIY